jgi:UDP-N-acetylmuramoylalanine--D-glutamate ligase
VELKAPEAKRPAAPVEAVPAKVVKEQKPAAPATDKPFAGPNPAASAEKPVKPEKPKAPANTDRPAALAIPPATVKSPLPEEAAPSPTSEKKVAAPTAPLTKETKKPSVVAPLKPVLARPDGEPPKLQLPPAAPKAEPPPAPEPHTAPDASENKKASTPAVKKNADDTAAERKKSSEKNEDLNQLKKQLKPAGEVLKSKAEEALRELKDKAAE